MPTATAFSPPDVVVDVRFAQRVAQAHVRGEAPLLELERAAELAPVTMDGAELLQRLCDGVDIVRSLGICERVVEVVDAISAFPLRNCRSAILSSARTRSLVAATG